MKKLTKNQKAVIEALKSTEQPMTTAQICEITGKNVRSVSAICSGMIHIFLSVVCHNSDAAGDLWKIIDPSERPEWAKKQAAEYGL